MDRAQVGESSIRLTLDVRHFKFRRPTVTRPPRERHVAASTKLSTPRSPRTQVLSRLPACAQYLPTEVVLNILGYVLPSVYDSAVRFRSDSAAFYKDITADFRCLLKDTQVCLYRTALVCRAWYPAANVLLYGCPFFSSQKGVATFARTLSAAPELGQLVKEAWFFNEENLKRLDPLGMRRKNSRRTQAELVATLRTYTPLDSIIVCNHGIVDSSDYPIDNILVYSLPPLSQGEHIPKLVLHGPAAFNEPYARHAKPHNLDPSQLEVLCMQDISNSPITLPFAPYLPTLPRLHTLQICMRTHDETPFVSSGTFPRLRVLEVYRDMFDNQHEECMRNVVVEEACIAQLERFHWIGRAVESASFRSWAETEDGLLNSVRDLAVGLLHKREHAFVREWRLPEKLEKLTIIVWHNDCPEAEAIGELGDAEGLLKALAACMRRNRQHRTFKLLELRAVSALPKKLYQQLKEVQEMCETHGFVFASHVGESLTSSGHK